MPHSARRVFLALLAVFCLATPSLGCVRSNSSSSLRGRAVVSPDGETYLVVDDDNGGGCGPIRVDGKVWKYPIGSPGPIAAGNHVIACGGEIEFVVPTGKTFHFDYWGP